MDISSPNLVNFDSGVFSGPVMPCGDMHQSITDALIILIIFPVSATELNSLTISK